MTKRYEIKRNQSGFTLIELMVVVAIIAILSTIGIGGFSNAQRKARDARRRADVKTIQTTMISSSDNNGNINVLDAVREAGGKLPDDPANRSGRPVHYLVIAPIAYGTTPNNNYSGVRSSTGMLSNIVFVSSGNLNGGVICAALEIPQSGNATDLRIDSEASKTPSSETPFSIPATGEASPAITTVNAGNNAIVDFKTEGGAFILETCTVGDDEKNCNLFCATF